MIKCFMKLMILFVNINNDKLIMIEILLVGLSFYDKYDGIFLVEIFIILLYFIWYFVNLMKKSINKVSINKIIIIVIKDVFEFNLGKCVLNIDLIRFIKIIGIGFEMLYVVFWFVNYIINNVFVIKINNKMSILLFLIVCLLIYEWIM